MSVISKRLLVLSVGGVVLIGSSIVVAAQPELALSWDEVDSPIDSSIRGLDVVDNQVVWAASDEGEVVRTIDGGASWEVVSPPDASDLLFRDVEAEDADKAVVLAIGPGEASRIFVTDDGGSTWTETFRNTEPTAFYNCVAFFTPRHGLAVSDPVDGKFPVITTDDGGYTWEPIEPAGMPDATGEFQFSASGTCLTVSGGVDAWIGTGGADARVFKSHDRGQTWEAYDTPLAAGDAAGVFSVGFDNPRFGIAIGGDFLVPEPAVDALAVTDDGGSTWSAVDESAAPSGYRSGLAWVNGLAKTAVAVGPTGSDVTFDRGHTWTEFSTTGFHAVECAANRVCWAAGSDGRIARLAIE